MNLSSHLISVPEMYQSKLAEMREQEGTAMALRYLHSTKEGQRQWVYLQEWLRSHEPFGLGIARSLDTPLTSVLGAWQHQGVAHDQVK
jgi:hypothetical protein